MLSIDIDETEPEKKTNQFINDIINFNNKHIIKCYNKTISNIPAEPRHISYTTPTIFINSQYESICYFNSSFQVIFFNILFRQLIMNTDCEKIIEHTEKSEDDYICYIQKSMML